LISIDGVDVLGDKPLILGFNHPKDTPDDSTGVLHLLREIIKRVQSDLSESLTK